MEKAIVCMVIGVLLVGIGKWLMRANRKADEIIGFDEDVDFVDGVDFCGYGKMLPPEPWPDPPACRCDDKPLVDMREAALVVDMWMVDDGDGNDVAYIEDENKARDFQEVYYPGGKVEFIETRETVIP